MPGDVLIGLPSAGLHTNGYSLARRVFFDVAGLQPDTFVRELGATAGAALLAPHRCYLPIVRPLLERGHVKGLAHITGGGITENLPRILPEGCAAEIDRRAWTVPPIFRFIQERGAVGRDEMYRTFNMGDRSDRRLHGARRRTRHERRGASRRAATRSGSASWCRASASSATSLKGTGVARRVATVCAATSPRVLISRDGDPTFSRSSTPFAQGRLDAQIALVISNRADAAGLERAREAGIETVCLQPARLFRSRRVRSRRRRLPRGEGVDLVCLAGFMRLVGPPLLAAFPDRILNIHPSLLPAFPGLDAQRQALEYGVRVSGATVHLVTSELDGGPIVLQAAVPVLDDDTVETLSARILVEEHRIYPEAIQSGPRRRLVRAMAGGSSARA